MCVCVCNIRTFINDCIHSDHYSDQTIKEVINPMTGVRKRVGHAMSVCTRRHVTS